MEGVLIRVVGEVDHPTSADEPGRCHFVSSMCFHSIFCVRMECCMFRNGWTAEFWRSIRVLVTLFEWLDV